MALSPVIQSVQLCHYHRVQTGSFHNRISLLALLSFEYSSSRDLILKGRSFLVARFPFLRLNQRRQGYVTFTDALCIAGRWFNL